MNSYSQSSEYKSWILYENGDAFSVAIPNTMELRDDELIEIVAEKVIEHFESRSRIKAKRAELVFQPKGMNGFEDEEAFSKYARILIYYKTGGDNEFFKSNEVFRFTDEQKEALNKYFKEQAVNEMKVTNTTLVQWFPLYFGNVNGYSYIKTSFTRQMGSNPIVKVMRYSFFNSNESVNIIISYRMSEGDIWGADFNKIINTFKFKKNNSVKLSSDNLSTKNAISVKKKSSTASQSTYSGRCQATTQKGTQCKRNAQVGSRYCWQHNR